MVFLLFFFPRLNPIFFHGSLLRALNAFRHCRMQNDHYCYLLELIRKHLLFYTREKQVPSPRHTIDAHQKTMNRQQNGIFVDAKDSGRPPMPANNNAPICIFAHSAHTHTHTRAPACTATTPHINGADWQWHWQTSSDRQKNHIFTLEFFDGDRKILFQFRHWRWVRAHRTLLAFHFLLSSFFFQSHKWSLRAFSLTPSFVVAAASQREHLWREKCKRPHCIGRSRALKRHAIYSSLLTMNFMCMNIESIK